MSEQQKSEISKTENLDVTFSTGESLNIIKTQQCVTLNLQIEENNKNTYSGEQVALSVYSILLISFFEEQLMKHPHQQDL